MNKKSKKTLKILVPTFGIAALAVSLPLALTSCGTENKPNSNNNQQSNPGVENEQVMPPNISEPTDNYVHFKGLSASTSYDVGQNLELTLKAPKQVSSQDFEYSWYLQAPNQPATLISTTSEPSVTLTDANEDWNNNQVYCVLTSKTNTEANGVTFYSLNGANATSNDVYYTATTLDLKTEFKVNGVSINVKTNNKIKVDTKDGVILVPSNGGTITLDATTDVSDAYSEYVRYTWYKNGQPISNANDSTYTITDPATNDTYSCSVQLVAGGNQSAVVNSNSYKINVVSGLDITSDAVSVSTNDDQKPHSDMVPAGSPVTLTANFKLNNQPVSDSHHEYSTSYQWYFNGKPLANQTAKTLTLNSLSDQHNGQYYCLLSVNYRNGGSVTAESKPTNLTVVTPGQISVGYVGNQTVYNGQGATFKVNANLSKSASNLKYQWQVSKDGSSWSDLPGSTNATLSLDKNQAFEYNNASFRCKVSDADTTSFVKTKYTNSASLTVVNPEFNPSLTSNQSGSLKYGSNLTLSVDHNFMQTISSSTGSYQPTFGYQWMVSKDNGRTWEKLVGETNSTLNLTNLDPTHNGQQYKCYVYQSDAVNLPKASETSGKYTNSFSVNLTQFDLNPTATVESNSVTSKDVKNNLGEEIKLSVDSVSDSLPSGYSVKYEWEENNYNNVYSNNWTTIRNQNNQTATIKSDNAGSHYYRCKVSVYYNGVNRTADPVLVQSSYSDVLEVNTYPKLEVINNGQENVTIGQNGSVTLTPQIKVINSTNEALNKNTKASANPDLSMYNVKYTWSVNDIDLTPNNIGGYPFINNNSYQTDSLEINTLGNIVRDVKCDGAYSLKVSLYDDITPIGTYTLNKPVNLTQTKATFKLTAKASAKLGQKDITLTADVENLESKSRQKRDLNNQDSDYEYTWYTKDWYGNTKKLNATPLKDKTFTLDCGDPNGVQNSWSTKAKFYCEVRNTNTNEVEYTTKAATFDVENPTINDPKIDGTTSIQANQKLTLTASASPSWTVNNKNINFRWEYSNGKENSVDSWSSINTSNNVEIVTNGNQSTLTVNSLPYTANNLKVRCLMSYGNQTKTVEQNITVTTGTVNIQENKINDVVNLVKGWFGKDKLQTTLQAGLGLYKDGESTQGWNPKYARDMISKLGITDYGLQNQYFGSSFNITTNAILKPISMLRESPTDTISLQLGFNLSNGYTWNLTSSLTEDNTQNYHLSSDKKTLYVTVDTDLKPTLTVKPQQSEINIMKNTVNMLSTNFTVSDPSATVTWYAYNPDSKQMFAINPDDVIFQRYFGKTATVEVSNYNTTWSLDIFNIQDINKLNNLQVVGVATLSTNGKYFEQTYNSQTCTIKIVNDDSETASVAH